MNEPQIPAEIKALATRAPAFIEHVRVVSSGDDMQVAMTELGLIKDEIKKHKPARDAFLSSARANLKFYEDFFDNFATPVLEQLTSAKGMWEQNIVLYRQAEQQRVAEENRRRQQEVERQQAALRAQQAAAAAKSAQQEAERRRKADEAELAGRAAQAAKLRSQADSIAQAAETSAQVTESAVATMVAPTVEPDIPKSDAGHFSSRSTGRIRSLKEIRDIERTACGGASLLVASVEADLQKRKQDIGLLAYICAVADGIRNGTMFPPPALKIDQTKLNDAARSLGSRFDLIPGCALETETSVVSKKR